MTALGAVIPHHSLEDGDYASAVLNILEDFGDEKSRLEDSQRAVLNILDDLDAERTGALEANRMKSAFLANMSHELRTPLNAIIGFSKLMYHGRVGFVSPEHREYLGDILTSSNHLLQLINDVLDLAKVEAGRMDFYPEPCDLPVLIDEVREILRDLAADRNIAIQVDVDVRGAHLEQDSSKLKQVCYNFISNAIKFTEPGGRVLIRARLTEPASFCVEVEDTGIGIQEADLANLFTEFVQLASTSLTRSQGTGLGLALTQRIVEVQGGKVWATSVPGKGSTFFASLPRVTQATSGDTLATGSIGGPA